MKVGGRAGWWRGEGWGCRGGKELRSIEEERWGKKRGERKGKECRCREQNWRQGRKGEDMK